MEEGGMSKTPVQVALEHLASIDMMELCNEAKVEFCRAIRDFGSCGYYVQHVLNSCGHASLCTECSLRYDLCPICRVTVLKDDRFKLRLFDECMETGLISKEWADMFPTDSVQKHLTDDVKRLYAFFNVAMENNLASLICHYVTDVCMDENAVSSDPVIAFLLDEAVVMDWCKQIFAKIIVDLSDIYKLEPERMKAKSDLLLKYSMQLNGISNVLEVLESSFKGTLSLQIYALSNLLDMLLKTKQHLDIMLWCARHEFFENIQSCHRNHASWCYIFRERKEAAVKRSWPRIATSSMEVSGNDGSTLFIEDALSNLELAQQDNNGHENIQLSFLQKDNGLILKMEGLEECYPFKNLHVAIDTLFLHGSSDMAVAKRAIFLYYLFDRQWTLLEKDWRYLLDDFAARFDIPRVSLLESLIFYLLDDNTEQALLEACRLLPEIMGPTTHPKIAQVLLERQNPSAALMVLRSSGRDGFGAFVDPIHSGLELVSLSEATTSVRVRVECGLLTEAFMYQRAYCSKAEGQSKDGSFCVLINDNISWVDRVEVLVTEICCLCLQRNLLNKMIDLPWNSFEEKFLHKCLLDDSCQDASTKSGSLLVVFYLKRHRYIEAYLVDLKLQSLEQSYISQVTNEEDILRIQSTSQWRSNLVMKGIELLPEVQQQQIKAGQIPYSVHSFTTENLNPKEVNPLILNQSSTFSLMTPSLNNSSILSTTAALYSDQNNSDTGFIGLNGPVNNALLGITHDINNSKSRMGNKTSIKMDIEFDKIPMDLNRNGGRVKLQNENSPLGINRSALAKKRVDSVPFSYLNKIDAKTYDYQMDVSIDRHTMKSYNGVGKRDPSSKPLNANSEEFMDFSWSSLNGGSGAEDLNIKDRTRWRADDTSDDEELLEPSWVHSKPSFATSSRGIRRNRFLVR